MMRISVKHAAITRQLSTSTRRLNSPRAPKTAAALQRRAQQDPLIVRQAREFLYEDLQLTAAMPADRKIAAIERSMQESSLMLRLLHHPGWARPDVEDFAQHRFKLDTTTYTLAVLTTDPDPLVAKHFEDVLPHHIGNPQWSKHGKPLYENIRPAMARAIDHLLPRKHGEKAADYAKRLNRQLLSWTKDDFARADSGYGIPLGTVFFSALWNVDLHFADLLVDALKHHADPQLAAEYQNLERYHLRAQGRETWMRNGLLDEQLLRKAFAEACALIQARTGQAVFRRDDIRTQKLGYTGVAVGHEAFNCLSRHQKNWRDFLPPQTFAHSHTSGRKTLRRHEVQKALERHLKIDLKKTVILDYLRTVNRAIHTAKLGEILPSGPTGFVTTLVDTLRHHPHPHVARYYRDLAPHHFAHGIRWRSLNPENLPTLYTVLHEALWRLVPRVFGKDPNDVEEAVIVVRPAVYCHGVRLALPFLMARALEGLPLRYGATLDRAMLTAGRRLLGSTPELLLQALKHHPDAKIARDFAAATVDDFPVQRDPEAFRTFLLDTSLYDLMMLQDIYAPIAGVQFGNVTVRAVPDDPRKPLVNGTIQYSLSTAPALFRFRYRNAEVVEHSNINMLRERLGRVLKDSPPTLPLRRYLQGLLNAA